MSLYFVVVQSKVLLWKEHYPNAEAMEEAIRALQDRFAQYPRILSGRVNIALPALPEDGIFEKGAHINCLVVEECGSCGLAANDDARGL